MARKEFKSGLDGLLQGTRIENNDRFSEKVTPLELTSNNEVRATFIINEKQLESIKAIAYWERCQNKQILEKAIAQFIQTYSDEDLRKILTLYKSKQNE